MRKRKGREDKMKGKDVRRVGRNYYKKNEERREGRDEENKK